MSKLIPFPVALRLRPVRASVDHYRRMGWYEDSTGIWETPHWTDRRMAEATASNKAAFAAQIEVLNHDLPL